MALPFVTENKAAMIAKDVTENSSAGGLKIGSDEIKYICLNIPQSLFIEVSGRTPSKEELEFINNIKYTIFVRDPYGNRYYLSFVSDDNVYVSCSFLDATPNPEGSLDNFEYWHLIYNRKTDLVSIDFREI